MAPAGNLKKYLSSGYKAWHYIIGQLSAKTIALLLILTLIFDGIIIPFQFGLFSPFKPQTAYAALSSYTYKKNITFDTTAQGANVATNQANFPVAVHINSSSWPTASERNNFFGAYNVGGKRIEFYDSDETTELSYEVEYYDQASQEALYWVKVPQVDGNSSTDKIVITYGNDPYGLNQDNPTGVWSNGYVSVYHLGDNQWGSSPEAKDSLTANNGTNTGTSDISGLVRRGRSFDGVNNYTQTSANNALDAYGAGTIEGYFVRDVSNIDHTLFTYSTSSSTASFWYLSINSANKIYVSYKSGSGNTSDHTGSTTINTATGYYLALTADGTNPVAAYLNGASETLSYVGRGIGVSNDWWADTQEISSWNHAMNIGAFFRSGTTYASTWDGVIDEVRLSSVTRTADWLKLSYYSTKKTNYNGDNGAGTSKLITFGAQQWTDSTVPTNPSGLTVGTVTASSVPLSWTASTDSGGSGLAGYKIERAPDSSGVPGTFAQINTSATNSYTDSTASASTKYWYRVRAYDNAGNNSNYNDYTTSTLQPGSTGYDAHIATAAAYAYDYEAFYTGDGTSGASHAARLTSKFDLSSIPTSATVDSATFSLYEHDATSTGGPATRAVNMHRLLRDWVETQVTWSLWKTGNSWTTAGAAGAGTDRNSAVSATVTLDNTAALTFVDWSAAQLTADVQDMVTNPSTNYGWTIEAPTSEYVGVAPYNYNNFYTSDRTTAAQRPKLAVSYSTPVSARTLANTPASPSASAASTSQINVSWSSGGAQDHYHVKSSLDSYASNIYNSTGTSTSQSGLTAGTQYTYRIYGVNADDAESSSYASVSKYTLSAPPTVPVASDGTTAGIDVSWTASASANHYHVYRDGVSGSGTLVYNSTGTSFNDSVTGSHTYYIYSVNGDDVENSSYISDSGSADDTAPSNPTNLSVGSVTATSVPLSWTASTDTGGSGVAGYKIERAPDSSGVPGTFAQINTSATNSYTDSTASASTKYWYRVRAYDNAGNNSNYNDYTSTSIYADAGDGYVYGQSTVWATARSTSSNFVTSDTVIEIADQKSGGGTYYAMYGFLKFDTSSIGASSTVTQASLKMTAIGKSTPRNFDISIVKSDWSGQDPVSASNREALYDARLTAAVDQIWKNSADIVAGNAYTSPNLDTAWINKSGYTYYGLTDSNDIADNAPTAISWVDVGSGNHGTASSRPELTVSYSTPVSARTIANTPTSPSATAASTSQINVSWATGGAQDHYHVKSSLDSYASNIYNSTGTSTSQSSLTAGTQYTYRIYGVNADDVQSSSYASVSKYTLSDPPTLPVATDGTYADKINVSWTSSLTANHYHVYKDGVSGVGTLVYNSTATSFDDTTTGSHTYYIYSVNGDDVENTSYISDSGSTDNTNPTNPTNLTVGSVTATSVPLSWTASTDTGGSGLAGYKIERAPDSGGVPGSFAQINTSATNSYTDSTASANTKYWYRVRAYDNAGNNSGYSGELNVDSNVKGLWHLNDGSGQSAADSSGNANNGTLGATSGSEASDPTWTTSGKHGNALSFDGTDDYVRVGDLSVGEGNTFTVEAWFKSSANLPENYIFSEGRNNSDVPLVQLRVVSNKLEGVIRDDAGTGLVVMTSTASVNDGAWHYGALVTSSSNNHKLYLDGIQVGSSTTNVGTRTFNQDAIGAQWRSAVSGYFSGLIDEVRISNVARTVTEISDYYNESNGYPKGARTLANTPASPSASAASTSQINVGWATGGAQDHYHVKSSLDSYASNIYNSTGTSTSQSGLTAGTQYTYRIYGVNADDVQSSSYASVSKYTLSDPPTLPVATDGTYADKINVSWTSSLTANHYHVYKDGVSGVGTLVYNSTATSFDDTTTGSHTYYIYSVNGDDVENTSYISDGGSTDNTNPTNPTSLTVGSVTATSVPLSWTASTDTGGSGVAGYKIERAPDSGGTPGTFAQIDTSASTSYTDSTASANTKYWYRVRAYDNAGNNSGYSGELNVDSNVKGLWHLNDGSGQSAADSSGNANNGTLGSTTGSDTNDPTWTTGKHGSALSFDGTDDYLGISDSASLAVSDFTLEAWVKSDNWDTDTSGASLINKDGEGAGTREYWLVVFNNGSLLRLYVWKNDSSFSYHNYTISPALQPNQYYYIAASYDFITDGTSQIKLFINGSQVGTTKTDVVGPPQNTSYGIQVGVHKTSIGNLERKFDGIVDEVRISNVARTATEISDYYNESNGYPKGARTLANTPASPSASAASTTQINVSWAAGGAQDHYHVKSSSDSYASNIYNSTGTSTSQSGLTAGTQYTYRIYGVNADDAESSSYASVSKYTLSDPPTLPVATDGTYADKINVSWTSSLTANHYHVYKDGVSGVGTLVYNSTATSFDDTTTGSHTYYIYAVNGDDVENSSYISDAGATMTVPSAPTIGTPSALSTTSIRWNFTDNASNEAGFKVHDGTDTTKASSATPNLSYLDEASLTANTQYTRHVHAYNDAGDSSPSTNASAYTKIESPTGGSFGTVTTTSIDLSATGSLTNLTSGSSGLYFENTTASTNSGWTQTNSWPNSSLSPNTAYTYQVTSRNADSIANSSVAIGTKYTLANTPGTPTVSDASASSLKVVINTNSNPSNTTYAIYNNTTSTYIQADGTLGASAVYQTYTNWGGASGTVNTGLSANTSYTYKVKARNGDSTDTGFSSNSTALYTLANTPASPSASAASTTQINVSWATGGAQDHYHVKSSSDSYATNIYNSTGTSTSQSSLAAGTQYTYRIYGVNADDAESASYASVSKYTLSDPPTLPVATDGTYADKINVSWTSSLTANHYHVYKDGVSGVGTLVYNSTATSFDDTTTGSHTYYIYSVNGDDVENSSYVTDFGNTDNTAPTNPSGLSATPISTTQINLSWTGSTDSGGSGLQGYKIERAPDSSGTPGSYNQIATSGSVSYSNTLLAPNTKYWYRVRAYDYVSNNSGYTSEVSKVTLSEPPTLPIATDNTYVDKIIVSWTASAQADHYHVYRDGSSGSGTLVYNSTSTSFDDAITGSHTYYIYSVNSEDAENSNYISDIGQTNPIPTAPTIGAPQALSVTSIRWNFTDNAANETGFKVHDSSESEKTASASANLSYLDESGLSANTQYTRHIHAYNGAGDSIASNNASKITLAATPSLASSKDTGSWLNSSSIAFSSNRVFGEGGVAYYRYAFNEISGYLVSGADTQWAGGVLSMPITASGLYYLNVMGYNAENVATAQVTYGPYQFDTEDPEVEITSHNSGDYVKGVISLTAVASDNIALSNVSFYDNSLSNRIGDNNAVFDTRSFEGARTIYAKATDTAGNTKVTSIILNIDNIAPSASLPDQNPGGGDNGSSGEGQIDEVKKGSKVSIFYKIKDNNDYADVEVKIYRRYKRANFEKLRNKTLSLISEKRALTKLKAKLQKRKDSISKKKLKSVKRKIKSLKKKFNKYNPYRIKKTITYDLGEVKTNKTVVFKYPARKRGVFRIIFAIQDKASNKSASLLEKWLKVK